MEAARTQGGPGFGRPAPCHDADWALVAPHRDRLVAVARGRGLSLPDAQDAAHHVLCRAVERGGLDAARVEAYLVKAVVNRCHDMRDEQLRTARLLARSSGDDRLAGPVDDAVCDRAHAQWLLGKLPARERRVVVLSAAGETVVGIAAKTGLSYPTVDRLLSRARKEMRRLAAPLAVAGAAAWRQRRLALPPAAATVALAGVTGLVLHTPPPLPAEPRRPPHALERRVPAQRTRPAAEAGRPAPLPAALLTRRPAAPPPARPGVPSPRAGDRSVAVPHVGDPIVAPRPGEEPLDHRVRKCLRNGVEVRMGSRVAIVCRDERKISAGIPPLHP